MVILNLLFMFTVLFCTKTHTSLDVVKVTNVPFVVGFLYVSYKSYESYKCEDRKIEIIRQAVNNTVESTIADYAEDEKSLQIKEFLNSNKESIDGMFTKQTTNENGAFITEKINTADISRKSIFEELNKPKHETLKKNLESLDLLNNNFKNNTAEIFLTGQHAIIQIGQEIFIGDSISNFIGRKFHNFYQKDTKEKSGALGDFITTSLLLLVSLPTIAGVALSISWPLLFLAAGISEIDFGFSINKKYRNGTLGYLLERYAVKKT